MHNILLLQQAAVLIVLAAERFVIGQTGHFTYAIGSSVIWQHNKNYKMTPEQTGIGSSLSGYTRYWQEVMTAAG